MKKRLEDPLLSWFVWSAVISLILVVIFDKLLPATLEADRTMISVGILVVFFVGWLFSLLHVYSLRQDWKAVSDLASGIEPVARPDCYLLKLLNVAETKLEAGMTISANNVISAYQMRRDHKRRIVHIISATLITVGLIGTILGLITSMTGLNQIVMSVDTSRDALISGLRETISGMGTAFYTTLFGAIFGGVFLKVLAHQSQSSMILISGMAMEFLESHAIEEAREQTSAIEEARAQIIDFSKTLSYHTHQLNESLSKASREVDEFSSSLLNSRLLQISQQLEDIAQTLRNVPGNQDPPGSV